MVCCFSYLGAIRSRPSCEGGRAQPQRQHEDNIKTIIKKQQGICALFQSVVSWRLNPIVQKRSAERFGGYVVRRDSEATPTPPTARRRRRWCRYVWKEAVDERHVFWMCNNVGTARAGGSGMERARMISNLDKCTGSFQTFRHSFPVDALCLSAKKRLAFEKHLTMMTLNTEIGGNGSR